MRLMKTIIGALLLALGTIGFVSCSQEEDNAMMQESGKLLKIRTSIADTRNVITSTTFHDGDEIGICVTTPRWASLYRPQPEHPGHLLRRQLEAGQGCNANGSGSHRVRLLSV